MRWLDSLLGREAPPTVTASTSPRHRFAIGSDVETWNALISGSYGAGRVSRSEAIRVPAVKRARDLIAGVIGTMPLHAINSVGEQVTHALLEQPERLSGFVRSVTVAKTIEDLLFESSSLWLVVTRTSAGFPESVQRIEWGQWSQDETTGEIRLEPDGISALGREIPNEDAILFTSPCDPLLVAGASAIRNLIALENTAALYAAEPQAAQYFTPSEGIDPEDPEEIERLLSDWQKARKTRATAYVPAAVQLNAVQRMTAEELQLTEARRFSITEISRLTGVDPDWLAVPVTSRVYNNMTDARRSFVDFVLSPYLRAVEERLTLGDCTPRGTRVRFNLDSFLRASTTERYASYQTALTNGFLTLDEVRELESRPPLTDSSEATDV